ncbi:MAG TPA: 30S ribosomal protein S8e [Nanoarchaeota archaeon]|nr:30S ribosomal protein S8e [Candidatus Woesearchaeota archaeon]HIH15708.1 30S ribosomal protein S8e [Nanoarchaeota archaeon]HIH58484.1 30S ribosomal protein S8e [Nanoarchaeota archaeon]HII13621.1 30S ribosomal protein S8e [Nanoarchaeota archaeon]HIJ05169.1 30S ribosomal protein S8e [Nanoarchaeota archaeon]
MALTSHRSKRKITGGRYQKYRKKRVFELRSPGILTKLAEKKTKTTRGVGGTTKQKVLSANVVHVFDPKTKKYSSEKIKTILENTANRHFVRRNIMTKGAVVETVKGKVKITSRPGQVGVLQGIFIK